MKALWLTFIFLFFSNTSATAQEAPKILYEQDETLLTTSIQVVFRTGSLHDTHKTGGMANFLGELMLRGTKKLDRSAFQIALERLGGTLDVYTAMDRTVFSGEVIKENTLAFLELLGSTLSHPALRLKEFRALKKEILAQITHAKNQNTRLGGLALRRSLFKGTALVRPGIGGYRSIKNLTLKQVKSAVSKRLLRENAFFAIATPLKEKKLTQKLSEIWKALPSGKPLSIPVIEIKKRERPEIVVVNKPGSETGSILLGQSGMTASDPDRFRLGLGNYIFGSAPLISRLFQVIRSEHGWTYSVGATYSAMGRLSQQKGLYVIYSTPAVKHTIKSLFKTLSLWKDYLVTGARPPEFQTAKSSLINSYPFEFDSADKRLSKKVYSYLYKVPILDPGDYEDVINEVNKENLIKALQGKHTPQGWVISIVADAKQIKKQLAYEQKDVPKKDRLTIAKVYSPTQVIQ